MGPPLDRAAPLALLALALCICACTCSRATSSAASVPADLPPASPPSSPPTPDGWQQWQPQTDAADTRLSGTVVSAWEEEVTVGRLLAFLSEQSAVRLTAVEELLPIRITIFVRNRMLDSVMSAVAHLFDGYWAFPRGRTPTSREYCLVPHETLTQPFDIWADEHSRQQQRALAAQRRPEREQRMADYRAALSLSPDELLAQYEQADPWRCADLLDPAVRPVVEQVSRLPATDSDQLLTTGDLARPLASFDPGFQAHLAQWAKGRWGRPQTARYPPDPDQLLRLQTPEERWRNAVVRFWWSDTALRCELTVPDVASFDAAAIRTSRRNPGDARRQLISLGYREDTPEYRAAAHEDAKRWQAWMDKREEDERAGRLPAPSLAPQPNRTDPHLGLTVDPAPLDDPRLSAPALLEAVAAQTPLAVLANYLPADQCTLAPGSLAGERPTVGDILEEIRRQRSTALSWNFHGIYLVANDAEYRFIEAARLSDEALAEWKQALSPGATHSLDDFASRLTPLNSAQVQALCEALPATFEMPIWALHVYAVATEGHRDQLRRQQPVPFGALTSRQQREVLRCARSTRPWLQSSDLSHTLLRTTPRAISTGEEGISFIIEYHFPDSPNDRDVVFTSPLQLTVPSR
jgi:hypothetical protein